MTTFDTGAERESVLRSAGACGADVGTLLAYGESLASVTGRTGAPLPLADEAHIEAWLDYAAEAATRGTLATLRDRFVQLSCPIEAGISQTPGYRAATRQGRFEELTAAGLTLGLEQPDAIELAVVATPAGRVPVLVAGTRADFETLARALTARNEPELIPASFGACLVSGLINWDRVARHRRAWQAEHPEADDAAWADEFRRLAADKARYQDRLILLSRGPYSNVAGPAGESADVWLARSLVIRREHECTHYFTWRVFGAIRTHVFDELLADFVGLVRASGRYSGELARRCLGLDAAGRRVGGRIDNYRGTPPLPDAAFDVVAVLAARATANLERAWDAAGCRGDDLAVVSRWAWALCHLPLDALAAKGLERRIYALTRTSPEPQL